MFDFICMELLELQGARSENKKKRKSFLQRDSNSRHLDSEATTVTTTVRHQMLCTNDQ